MIMCAVLLLLPQVLLMVLFGRLRQLALRKGQTFPQWQQLAQMVAAHTGNGHEMLYDGQAEAVLNVRVPDIPKVARMLFAQVIRTYNTDVEAPATAGDLGYMHSEVFRLVRIPQFLVFSPTLCAVICIPDGMQITRDDDQEFGFPEDEPCPTGMRALKLALQAWRTVLSTGMGIMTGDELAELIGQVQRAEPVRSENRD